MVGQVAGYVRVSSAEQNPEWQLEVLGEWDQVFTDRLSGSSRATRHGLAELTRYVCQGDTVLGIDGPVKSCHSGLCNLVADLTGKGTGVEFINESNTVDKNGSLSLDS